MTAASLSAADRRDLLEATRWIAEDNLSAARALRRSVVRAAMTIGEHPEIGSFRPEIVHAPFRCMPLVGFPYVVIYHADRRPPVIARILHGARDLPEILHDL
jgi:toxin ParE1/3/4